MLRRSLPLYVLLSSPFALAADLPVSFAHAGFLLDGADAPVTQSGLSVSFKLWSSRTGTEAGQLVWPASGEASCTVDVLNGRYATVIGSECGTGLTTAHVSPTEPRFLEVSVAGVTLSPRLMISAAPTATLAGHAATAAHATTADDAARADHALSADHAEKADEAGHALAADHAKKADAADHALAADTATKIGNLAPSDLWTKTEELSAAKYGNGTLSEKFASLVGASGVVGIGAGGLGTDASAFPAGSLPMMGNGSFAPVSALKDGLLVSDGAGWEAKTPAALGLARYTTSNLTLYVRTDGDDTCDGLASTVRIGTSTSCAVKTLQKAIDLVPDYVAHDVIIELATGTYYASEGQRIGVIQKVVKVPGGTLLLRGNGTVVLSGARAGAPNEAAEGGLLVINPTVNLTVENLTVQRTTGTAIEVQRANAILSDVSVLYPGNASVSCHKAASCSIRGTCSFSNSVNSGIAVSYSSSLSINGTVTVNSSGGHGLYADYGSGIFVTGGKLTSSNNGSAGLLASVGSVVNVAAAAEYSASGNIWAGIASSNKSIADMGGKITISTPAKAQGVAVHHSASASFWGTNNIAITCGGVESHGFVASVNSMIETSTTGNITIASCTHGVGLSWMSGFSDWNAVNQGGRTITGQTSYMYADRLSTIHKGRFNYAANGGCTNNSICN